METADRWLLNSLSTVELGLLIVGGGVLISLVGFALARRFLPSERRIMNNEVAGVLLTLLGAFYGVVLGFAIVVLFEDYRSTNESVKNESTALAQLYRGADTFPVAKRDALGRGIAKYAIAVRTLEWPLMKEDHESQRAHDLLGTLYTDVESDQPQTRQQVAFYNQEVATLNTLVSARRERLNDADESLPTPFQVLLLGGAVVLIVFLFFFGMANVRTHLLMVTGVSLVLSFSLLLVLLLAFPFSGQIAVSSSPFQLGVVGNLSPVTGRVTGSTCDNCYGPP